MTSTLSAGRMRSMPKPQLPKLADNVQHASKPKLFKQSRRSGHIVRAAPQKRVKNAIEDQKQSGVVQRLLRSQKALQEQISIKELLAWSLGVSLTFGTAFQVTHNNGLLPVYDFWPIKIGPFLESGLVPLVLAPIWLLYGYLTPLLDEVFATETSTIEATAKASELPFVAWTWFLCAAQFILSDIMYLQGVPHVQIYPVMAAASALIWRSTDGTKTGLILSTLLAIGAPLGEAVIVAFGLWHYDRPDNPLGVCYWTAFCYASYAYGVANFARWQVQQQKLRQS